MGQAVVGRRYAADWHDSREEKLVAWTFLMWLIFCRFHDKSKVSFNESFSEVLILYKHNVTPSGSFFFLLTECQYWGSELQLPTLDFEDVLTDDEHAYKWLSSLKKVGIVRLTGASDKRGEVLKLGKRIGFLYLTFYGWVAKESVFCHYM